MHQNWRKSQAKAQGWEEGKRIFHSTDQKDSTYQAKSFLNSTLRRIGWESFRKQDNKSIIRRRKVWPGQTTMRAWCNRPINDWRSFLVQHLRVDQWVRASSKVKNLSAGRRAIWAAVSNSILRTTMQEAGAKHFWRCKGRPNLATTATATWRLEAQTTEFAGAAIMKSSK